MATEYSSISQKANFEPHRVFYISRADVLYGSKGTTIFKQIQLSHNYHAYTIDKFFFLSHSFLVIVKIDTVIIFTLDLEIKNIFAIPTNQSMIRKVLAVPSEINTDDFIYISTGNCVNRFNLIQSSIVPITSIDPSRGIIKYQFFLTPSIATRLLLIGFEDQSVLVVNMISFTGNWMEASSSIPASVFQSMKRFFASNTHIFLVSSK